MSSIPNWEAEIRKAEKKLKNSLRHGHFENVIRLTERIGFFRRLIAAENETIARLAARDAMIQLIVANGGNHV